MTLLKFYGGRLNGGIKFNCLVEITFGSTKHPNQLKAAVEVEQTKRFYSGAV